MGVRLSVGVSCTGYELGAAAAGERRRNERWRKRQGFRFRVQGKRAAQWGLESSGWDRQQHAAHTIGWREGFGLSPRTRHCGVVCSVCVSCVYEVTEVDGPVWVLRGLVERIVLKLSVAYSSSTDFFFFETE